MRTSSKLEPVDTLLKPEKPDAPFEVKKIWSQGQSSCININVDVHEPVKIKSNVFAPDDTFHKLWKLCVDDILRQHVSSLKSGHEKYLLVNVPELIGSKGWLSFVRTIRHMSDQIENTTIKISKSRTMCSLRT